MSEPLEPPASPAPPETDVPVATPAAEPEPPGSSGAAPRWARPALIAVAALALVALFWPREEAAPGRRPTGFVLDEAGRPIPLERELRAATLVHFWASWCAPCVTEMPELLAYARETTNERFQVVLVAVGDEPKAARRFLGDPKRPLYFDPSWELASRFRTDRLPESHLVVGGKVVESFVGATRWSDPAVRAQLQKWTASPASATP